ncbi:MAG: type II secretion system F family protein [Desulfurococcales archaeon]|nr:type II secretion system F family protein [Desulfurococcales archaeon]
MPSSTARRGRALRKPTLREVIDAVALALFENWGKSLAKRFELDRAIIRAGMSEHPVIFASRILLYTFVAATISGLTIVALALAVPPTTTYFLIAAVIGILIPVMIFAIQISYPATIASSRKAMVDNELPFFMAYISTMAKGGVSVDKILERVAELKVFKAMRDEANKIIAEMRFFGRDPLTAIETVVKYHPSTKFRDMMLGYVTTLRSGGDVIHYLETRTRELFISRMSEMRSLIERLGSYLEVYIILGVIMSITIFVFFSVSGTITAIQAARVTSSPKMDLTMPSLYNFVGLPAIGAMVLFMAHVSQPRSPVKRYEPYIVMLTSIPFAFLAFLGMLMATGGFKVFSGVLGVAEAKSVTLALTAAILVVTVPPWITYRKEMLGTKGLINSTADFLRDLSEVRKTGLSPEKCIISLANRDYGNLTPVVNKAAAALTSGMSLESALRRVLKKVHEWFVIAIFRFLTDSITVGGGSPDIIDALSRFTQDLAEAEVEMRRRLRAYIMMPYFGTMLLASSPIIIINLLLQASKNVTANQLAPLILVLSAGTLINAVIMGLVAGKVSELNTAAGFKHAAIMTILSTATILITLTMMGI